MLELEDLSVRVRVVLYLMALGICCVVYWLMAYMLLRVNKASLDWRPESSA